MADHELEPAKYSRGFYADLADRAISTAAQTLIGVATAAGFDLLEFDLAATAALVGTATAISILKAFAVERKAVALY